MNATESETAAETQSELKLQVNGETRSVTAPCTVAQLLEILQIAPAEEEPSARRTGQEAPPRKRVAVAVNREVVLRSNYAEATLHEGDRVEILEAVGGG